MGFGNKQLEIGPTELPADLRQHVIAFATGWARHASRPTPRSDMTAAWDSMICDWAEDPELPLLVRKASENRGQVVFHKSGRRLVPVDNSPAQWVFALACREVTLSLSRVRSLFDEDEVPVAMIIKKAEKEKEKAQYRCVLGKSGTAQAGWKLGHLNSVGLKLAGVIEAMPIETLKQHFRALMSPSNMFLIPLPWSGLAEIPEVIDAIRQVLLPRKS